MTTFSAKDMAREVGLSHLIPDTRRIPILRTIECSTLFHLNGEMALLCDKVKRPDTGAKPG